MDDGVRPTHDDPSPAVDASAAAARPDEGVAGAATPAALLLMLCTILYTTSLSMLAPLLVELAIAFDSSVPAMGQLIAATSIVWGPLAVLMSPLSDRTGRKPMIVLGMLGLGATVAAQTLAHSVAALVALRLAAGIAGGALGPSVNAAAVDYFPPARRGRALGLVTAGFSLAALVGVPAVTAIAAVAGWRAGFLAVALAMGALAIALILFLPADRRATPPPIGHLAAYRGVLATPTARPLFVANLAERMASVALFTYLPSYLLLRYALPLGTVALISATIALGALAGTLLGGRLAGRDDRPTTFALCQGVAAALALPLLALAPGVYASAALGIAFSFANYLSRPSFTWMIGHLSTERRGAVMGLYALTNQGGIVLGAAVGGLALSLGGYPGVAALVAGMGALAVLIANRWLRAALSAPD